MAGRGSRVVILLAVFAVLVGGCCTGQPRQAAPETAAAVAPAPASAAAGAPQAAAPGELAVLETWKIGGPGGWDYLTVDSRNRKVYIARSDSVQVIDADHGTITGAVADVTGAHGVVLVPRLNLGFATAGEDNTIHVFDLTTLLTTRKIPAGKEPDAIIYDPATGKIFAFNAGSCDATIVKAADHSQTTTMPLGGKPEMAVSDGRGRVYVNLQDKSAIAAIDSTAEKVIDVWQLAPGEGPTGLTYDRGTHRLFAACANGKLIVLDASTGKVVADVPIGSGPDGAAFDRAIGVVIPNGEDGTMSVVREAASGNYEVVETVRTTKGARTIAADRRNHRFYLPCTASDNGKDVFSLIVVGPAMQQ